MGAGIDGKRWGVGGGRGSFREGGAGEIWRETRHHSTKCYEVNLIRECSGVMHHTDTPHASKEFMLKLEILYSEFSSFF